MTLFGGRGGGGNLVSTRSCCPHRLAVWGRATGGLKLAERTPAGQEPPFAIKSVVHLFPAGVCLPPFALDGKCPYFSFPNGSYGPFTFPCKARKVVVDRLSGEGLFERASQGLKLSLGRFRF
jgi:hypothetical protein